MKVNKCCLPFAKAHPGNRHFAAAECGTNPDINVFEFPSLKLYRILRGGAERSYVNMDFRQVPIFRLCEITIVSSLSLLGSFSLSLCKYCLHRSYLLCFWFEFFLWSPYVIGQTIIFSSCFFFLMVSLCNRADHYIFALCSFFFLSSSFFSSPNLSGRRLDVYHTLAHGVALVRI